MEEMEKENKCGFDSGGYKNATKIRIVLDGIVLLKGSSRGLILPSGL